MKVYVVEFSSGAYSDYHQHIAGIFESLEGAKIFVNYEVDRYHREEVGEYDYSLYGPWAEEHEYGKFLFRQRSNYDHDMFYITEMEVQP